MLKTDFLNAKGQTLLEIVIAISLIMVILFALVIVTINALRNSQQAKNQTEATKLAQEGLELVRIIKENNCPIDTGDAGVYFWYAEDSQGDNLIWNSQLGDTIKQVDSFKPVFAPDGSCIKLEKNLEEFGIYKRKLKLKIKLPEADQLYVTSTVEWTDLSGSHSSFLVTIITKQ
ncbi:hypothetical protein HYS97_01155 [Candidatus Daviesbacteria bacterium]|nr:hypothetical protein [Candidatus Daviesbacteria bacterium]